MSTKETAEILELVNWLKEQADSQEGGPSSNLNKAAGIITSLSTRLEAAERELEIEHKNHPFYKELSADFEEALGPHPTITNGCWVQRTRALRKELAQLQQANAELVKDKERLDWVESHKVNNVLSRRMAVYFVDNTLHDSFRQAIDAAITKGTV